MSFCLFCPYQAAGLFGPGISTTTTSTTTTTTTYQAVRLFRPSTSASTEEMTTLPWPGSKAPDDEDDFHLNPNQSEWVQDQDQSWCTFKYFLAYYVFIISHLPLWHCKIYLNIFKIYFFFSLTCRCGIAKYMFIYLKYISLSQFSPAAVALRRAVDLRELLAVVRSLAPATGKKDG